MQKTTDERGAEEVTKLHTVHVHKTLESVVLDLAPGSMRILSSQAVSVEVSAVLIRGSNLRTEGVHREIVAPDLAVVCAVEDLSLKRRLAVDTCVQKLSQITVT